MKRVLYGLIVSFFILLGFSGCDLLEGVTIPPPPPTPIVKPMAFARPTPAPTPMATARPTPAPTPTATARPTPTPIPTAAASGTPRPASVDQVITNYYDAIEAQNYPQAYTYLDSNATDATGQRITLSSFEQMAQLMESMGGQVVSFEVAVYLPSVVMSVARTRLASYHAHLQVQQEGQTWKITSLDRV